MIFLIITDQGIHTQPVEATNLADAATKIKQLYGFGTGQIHVALLLPTVTGTLTQNQDPSLATIQMTGDSQTQQQIRNAAGNALTANATYLAIGSPTNAQVVAQTRALTQQVDGLIRLAIGDFTATT